MRPLQDTQNKFPRSIWGVSSFYKIQLARNNWKIKGIFSGLVTQRLYFLKKYDAKQPNFPSCRNWPICGTTGWPSSYMAEFPTNAYGATCWFNLLAIRYLLLWCHPMGPLCLWQCFSYIRLWLTTHEEILCNWRNWVFWDGCCSDLRVSLSKHTHIIV